jgi:hypothetical protein
MDNDGRRRWVYPLDWYMEGYVTLYFAGLFYA